MTEKHKPDLIDDIVATYCEINEISEDDLYKMLRNQYGEK